MNKIFFLTVAFSLLVTVCQAYPPWNLTPPEIANIKKLMKGTHKPVDGKCQVGWHKMSTWSLDQWGFSSGCVRNDANCANFDVLTGHCKLCKWATKLKKDAIFGDWCSVTWYAWLFFYMLLFFGIGLLVMTIVACKSCCTQNRAYKKMKDVEIEDCHVEMVSQGSYSEEDSYVHYSNPYHH
jgi:hypothetical protein